MCSYSPTAWCSEIGSLTSMDACNLGASMASHVDIREPISLHQASFCSQFALFPFSFSWLVCHCSEKSFHYAAVRITCYMVCRIHGFLYWVHCTMFWFVNNTKSTCCIIKHSFIKKNRKSEEEVYLTPSVKILTWSLPSTNEELLWRQDFWCWSLLPGVSLFEASVTNKQTKTCQHVASLTTHS